MADARDPVQQTGPMDTADGVTDIATQADSPAGRLLLDVRSVNSRFFELNVRMPDEFRWAEAMIRD